MRIYSSSVGRLRYVIHVAVLSDQNTVTKDRHSSNASLMNYKCALACLLVKFREEF